MNCINWMEHFSTLHVLICKKMAFKVAAASETRILFGESPLWDGRKGGWDFCRSGGQVGRTAEGGRIEHRQEKGGGGPRCQDGSIF